MLYVSLVTSMNGLSALKNVNLFSGLKSDANGTMKPANNATGLRVSVIGQLGIISKDFFCAEPEG